MKTKTCEQCGEKKPISKFALYSDGKYRAKLCSSCQWKRQHKSYGRSSEQMDKIHNSVMQQLMPVRQLSKREIQLVAHLYQR